MNVFVVYCHPSAGSFTSEVRHEFLRGLAAAGHRAEVSDLYAMEFRTDMDESEYSREAFYRCDLPVPADVNAEQEKIQRCDAIVFIYPVFWTEAPAKLVGWFDRVWTYGFSYGERAMKKIPCALALCVAGRTKEHLEQYGHLESMRRVMLGDRIFDRAERSDFAVLDGMSHADKARLAANRDRHLKTAYELAQSLGNM